MRYSKFNELKGGKLKIMNKTAKSTNTWMIISGIIVVALLAAITYGVYTNQSQTSIGGAQTSTSSGGTVINTVNPAIQVAGIDAQESGTPVAMSAKASTNGGAFTTVTLGTDTAVPGQTIDLLLTNNTGYHNAVKQGIVVTPSSFPVTVLFNKNASMTESIYTTTGLVITNTNLGGAQNQTALGNGATYNLKDEMQAGSLTSTQDMVCVIELTAGSNASTSPSGALLDGQQPFSTSKPTWYTTAGINSNVYLFNMGALSTSATSTHTIQLNSKSTGAFPALSYMKKSCYTKEWFIDPNTGKATYDVADSQGTVKSMATYTYYVYFQ
jgi:hypothetical protein